MFEGLISRFQIIRRKILGYGRITDHEIDAILKDIRITLLEADVNYKVVRVFISDLKNRCTGLELAKKLRPGELIIKVVFEEIVNLLGARPQHLDFTKNDPLTINLFGLQGVGKTTTAVKLANRYKSKHPLLVPADAKRPAAVKQLMLMAKRADIDMFPLHENNAVTTVTMAKDHAVKHGHSLIIIDTAGRLHLDEELIEELRLINKAAPPDYSLLVADGMSGQDAVNQAVTFNEKIGLQGVILTKLDGDARGGAALSIARTVERPIFFVGMGEDINGLEQFYPDRMAQRIMGMGDLTSLVEKVKAVEGEFDKEKMGAKIIRGELNFEDFLVQLKAVKKLGPLAKLASLMPGVKESDIDEKEIKKIEAIINSMTKKERQEPDLINGARKRRIAAGSGTTMRDVNQLLKQFFYARDLLKKMGKSKMPGKLPLNM